MKYLSILMVGVALIVGGCGEKVEYHKLEKKNGITYFKGAARAFTGTAINKLHFPNRNEYGLAETPYLNGKRHGTQVGYDYDGRKEWETPWVNGKRDGFGFSYHFGRQKKSETPYVNDKIHGAKIEYQIGGIKSKVTPYVNGKKHGTQVGYDYDGSKWWEIVWENGNLIEEKKFKKF